VERIQLATQNGGTGSVVNNVTKSGGNEYHGEILELWRPAGPAAALAGFTAKNAASGNDLTNDTLDQSAVRLSKPVGSGGTTQFLVAAEYSREDKASPIISPVEPGSFLGRYRGWLGLLRVDHQINDRNNLFFAAIWTPFTIQITTERWETTACRAWIAFFAGALIPPRLAKQPC
jgi:hypothetical protein